MRPRRCPAPGPDSATEPAGYAEEHLPVERAAAAGFVDEVIAPAESRIALLHALGDRP